MPTLTNTTKGDLVLHDGTTIPARSSVEMEGAAVRAHRGHDSPVSKAWFASGALTSDEPEKALEKPPVDPSGDLDGSSDLSKYTDEQLRAFLESKKLKVDGRWAREKLLAEAAKVQTKD